MISYNNVNNITDKECPFCKESIKNWAIKCKHCWEILDSYSFSWRLNKVDRTLKLYDKLWNLYVFSFTVFWLYLSSISNITIKYVYTLIYITIYLILWVILYKKYKEVLDNS